MQENNAAAAYSRSNRSVGTPRSIEYQAFQRVTARLQHAAGDSGNLGQLAEAVHLNTKLWITLASDLMSNGNQLPQELRGQLFGLAEFSRRHGLKVLQQEADPLELIDVNAAIMRGLRGISLSEGEQQEAETMVVSTSPAAIADAPAATAAGG